ncbi:type III pantothenate kinase [Xylophilus rhododendri]|uniref:Type III pantothenate kinase n=1 Tax=Xylophilus rhododendri TaxID=2697032 RepID=A0A857J1X7_9BURK|nr:type III pantothenate kinase [Xylophilus rhododendri]QHI97924.1 type III pantothenate kinase [Xylophilus rhododendri]
MTFLAIDVGNTRLKWAMFSNVSPGQYPIAQGVEFLENIGRLSEGPWAELPAPTRMLGCIVAGDAIRRLVEEQLELWNVLPQWVIASKYEAGVTNGYDHPLRLGADRWLAMIGAYRRMRRSQVFKPLIVVMVGTAVTIDALDSSGMFLGGLILPGHGIMLRALESGTAGLHVPTGEVVSFPKNTSDALTSGGTYAIAGAVRRMVDTLGSQCNETPLCVMSGGAGWKMVQNMDLQVELVEMLIFDGLLEVAFHRGMQDGEDNAVLFP